MKHLNPRQGITIFPTAPPHPVGDNSRVKHLNHRQGITIEQTPQRLATARPSSCETPKSPPGDYKVPDASRNQTRNRHICVKHLNPRQGITNPRVPLQGINKIEVRV